MHRGTSTRAGKCPLIAITFLDPPMMRARDAASRPTAATREFVGRNVSCPGNNHSHG